MNQQAESANARRTAYAESIRTETGIDEAMIERLVRAFYLRVRNDEILGPVFAAAIADWEPHLRTMFAFWSSVILMTGRYHGSPMAKHAVLTIDTRHFERWLQLFSETATELCPTAAAARFNQHARRIAQSLEMGIAAEAEPALASGKKIERGAVATPTDSGRRGLPRAFEP